MQHFNVITSALFQVRVPVFPVLSSVLIGPTSALTDGCSPHVRSTLMFLGWLGFSSNR